jgi:transcriptional regulator with XRE-family HTH domain
LKAPLEAASIEPRSEDRGADPVAALRAAGSAVTAVDRDVGSGVDSRPGGDLSAPILSPILPPIVVSSTMETEHFGTFLKRARESREILLADVAQKIKVSRSTLELLEKGQFADLPAGVYVRGFIRSFARAVGADETEPLLLYERAVEAKSRAEKTREITPVSMAPMMFGAAATEDDGIVPRRGLGLAVFVIILLLIATITLSLLLRRPPPSGEGLSLAPSVPSSQVTGRTPST